MKVAQALLPVFRRSPDQFERTNDGFHSTPARMFSIPDWPSDKHGCVGSTLVLERLCYVCP
jgi:hypothetical protein